jgi:hypothetical protein
MPRSQVRADKLFEKNWRAFRMDGHLVGEGRFGQQGFSSVEKVFP